MPQLKKRIFLLEGLNAFSTSFYFYYLFFFMRDQFGWGNSENLMLAALNGLIYTVAAFFAGRFAEKYGRYPSLKISFSGMAAILWVGTGLDHAFGHVVVLAIWTLAISFSWSSLAALVSHKETPVALPRIVGMYNLVWAAAGAVSYFFGGAILETFGLNSLFWMPIGVHLVQLGLTVWIEKQARTAVESAAVEPVPSEPGSPPLNPRPIARAKLFLRLAWIANPFGYVAINTVVATVPALARDLDLSPMLAGFFGSTWFFARLAAFWVLRLWDGWLYRFPYFLGAFVLLVTSFGVILLVPNIAAVFAAQIAFGFAVGLMYYSSLYYSMAAGAEQAAHGGIHEAVIGLGIFAGPAIGAAATALWPHHERSAGWAVSALLMTGLLASVWLCYRAVRLHKI